MSPVKLSPSQLELFQSCQRKWALKYIEGLKEPERESTNDGKAIHTGFERYSKGEGLTGPWLPVLVEGIKYLPLPGTGIVEGRFEVPFCEGGLLVGIRDLFYQDPKSKVWTVTDHKSCGSFRYALTPRDFRSDTQAVEYAYQAMEEKGVDRVFCEWLYHLRNNKTPQTRQVKDLVHRYQIEERHQELVQIGRVMVGFRNEKVSPWDLPRSDSACDKYGGCPFRTACESGPEKLRRLQKMNIRDRIAQRAMEKAVAKASEVVTEKEEKADGAEGINPPPVKAQPAPKPKAKPAEAPKQEEKKDPKPKRRTMIGTLYVDCIPVDGGARDFSVWVSDVIDDLREDLDGKHYRLADVFGGQAAILEAAVAKALDEGSEAYDFFVDSRTNEGRDCLTLLSSRAISVVRALR